VGVEKIVSYDAVVAYFDETSHLQIEINFYHVVVVVVVEKPIYYLYCY
jgi:hypothetical protein